MSTPCGPGGELSGTGESIDDIQQRMPRYLPRLSFRATLKRGLRRALRLGRRDDDAHLFRSPANAERLRSALEKSLNGQGTPFTVEELRAELRLGEK